MWREREGGRERGGEGERERGGEREEGREGEREGERTRKCFANVYLNNISLQVVLVKECEKKEMIC